MGYNNSNTFEEAKVIPYDLRQRRAKIVADCMDEVVLSAKGNGPGKFYLWLKNIEDLYDISHHAFNLKTPLPDGSMIEKRYETLKDNVKRLSNKYAGTWTGTVNHSQQTEEIETALRELFRFLMVCIEESGLFGRGYEYDEDEI